MAIAACGGGGRSTTATTPPPSNQAPPPASPKLEAELTPSPDDPVVAMTSFADQMCACHDKPCADQVSDRMMAWGHAMAKQANQDGHPTTDDDARRIAAMSERLARCLTAIAQGAPATP